MQLLRYQQAEPRVVDDKNNTSALQAFVFLSLRDPQLCVSKGLSGVATSDHRSFVGELAYHFFCKLNSAALTYS